MCGDRLPTTRNSRCKLVDGKHGRRRIVDRRRQRFQRNIDQDAKREHRVLLDAAFRPESDQGAEPPFIDCATIPYR